MANKKSNFTGPVKAEEWDYTPAPLPPDPITHPLHRPGFHPSPLQVCGAGIGGAQGTGEPHQTHACAAYQPAPTSGTSPFYQHVHGQVEESTKFAIQTWRRPPPPQKSAILDFDDFYGTGALPGAHAEGWSTSNYDNWNDLQRMPHANEAKFKHATSPRPAC